MDAPLQFPRIHAAGATGTQLGDGGRGRDHAAAKRLDALAAAVFREPLGALGGAQRPSAAWYGAIGVR